MSQKDKIQVAVAGCGYWGPNLIRNLSVLPTAHLRALCDMDQNKLGKMSALYNPTYATQNFEDLLKDDELQAIVIATPASTHYALAKQALEAGKHTMVEKPLALKSDDAAELVKIAQQKDLRLMVGHTFQYNPAVNKVRELIRSGDMGEIIYAYMTRVNLGIIRDDLNVMWNLAPHDISILLWTFDSLPHSVSARSFAPLRPDKGLEDIAFILLEFENGAIAHIHNSWLDPNKIRQATFVGTKKMVVYDDVDTQRRIQIFDKGVDRSPNPSSYGEFQLTVREGDVLIPRISTAEPLKLEMGHFVECVQTGKTSNSDGVNGWQVLRIMEAAEQSSAQGGTPVQIDWQEKAF